MVTNTLTADSAVEQYESAVAAADERRATAVAAAERRCDKAVASADAAVTRARTTLKAALEAAGGEHDRATRTAVAELDAALKTAARADERAYLVDRAGGVIQLRIDPLGPPLGVAGPAGGGAWYVDLPGRERQFLGSGIQARRALWAGARHPGGG